jgi:hypothetical protein
MRRRFANECRASIDEFAAATFHAQFGSIIGKEAYAPSLYSQPYLRTTDGVTVFIVHDPESPKGFWVHTSYPSRR